MSYQLIITEKPSSAQKIATALADPKTLKKDQLQGVPFYQLQHAGKDIVVCSAVGHLFTVAEKNKGAWTYPVFNVEWVASAEQSKAADFTKKYANAIKKLAKDAKEFVIATDYDIEGEVIGYNILRFLCNQKDGMRMKFSTLTVPDLKKSYDTKSKSINWPQAKAGVTRHELDWYYGINLSRALSLAVKSAGQHKILSSGRVQGPALKIIVDKEKEIQKFIPQDYWQITLNIDAHNQIVEALHKDEKIFDKATAQTIFDKLQKLTKKVAQVKDVQEKEFTQKQPTPFDLTTLQTESYRVHNISPSETLALAQDLYTSGWISYPRTSSQKLPKELELAQRIKDLSRQPEYKKLAEQLLAKGWTIPHEGAKTDDAHPAIHPTGLVPTSINERQAKVYDLIVRRFLACFADEAKRATMTVVFDAAKEDFIAKGTRTTYKGWHEYYGPYAIFDEIVLPPLKVSEIYNIKDMLNEQKQTKPPKRYTPASIIKELEKRNLGTKATRATIVDNLYDRGYVTDKQVHATQLGIHTVQILEKYSPKILDETLTREFEEELEKIRQTKSSEEQVLGRARTVLKDILDDFKTKQRNIGQELLEATRTSDEIANTTVACPVCKRQGRNGMLMIKRSKYGRFLGCSTHPECTFTFNIPNIGEVKPSGKVDEKTGQELLFVRRGKNVSYVNVDPEAEENKKQRELIEQQKQGDLEIPGAGTKCPNCEAGKFVVRRSMYGVFLGCDNYPKCKTMRKLNKNADGTFTPGDIISQNDKKPAKTASASTDKAAKKTVKKAAKKTTKKAAKKA